MPRPKKPRRGYRAAGLLLLRPEDSKILLLRRSAGLSYPGHWGVPGGSVETGETDLEAAGREAQEELGGLPGFDILGFGRRAEDSWFTFTTFFGMLFPGQTRWRPRLNPESDAWGWFAPDRLPSPLMPGTRAAAAALLKRAGSALGAAEPMPLPHWERCGNTAFYQETPAGDPTVGMSFINPFNLVRVMVSGASGPEERGHSLVSREQLAEFGRVQMMAGAAETQADHGVPALQTYNALTVLDQAVGSAPDLTTAFERLRALDPRILDLALAALFNGFDARREENIYLEERARLVVEAGSPAHGIQDVLEGETGAEDPTIVVEDLPAGVWEALADYGVIEC